MLLRGRAVALLIALFATAAAGSPFAIPLVGGPGSADEFSGPAVRQFLIGRADPATATFASDSSVALVSISAGYDGG